MEEERDAVLSDFMSWVFEMAALHSVAVFLAKSIRMQEDMA